jgi:hypothetical protein
MAHRQKGPWPRPNLTDVQSAWVAAVLDCEGMLTIHTPWNKQRKKRVHKRDPITHRFVCV